MMKKQSTKRTYNNTNTHTKLKRMNKRNVKKKVNSFISSFTIETKHYFFLLILFNDGKTNEK